MEFTDEDIETMAENVRQRRGDWLNDLAELEHLALLEINCQCCM